MVTHNEMFLHKLANRFVVFQEGRIHFFEGSYQEFLDSVGWAAEEITAPGPEAPSGKKSTSKKERRRLRAELVTHSRKKSRR